MGKWQSAAHSVWGIQRPAACICLFDVAIVCQLCRFETCFNSSGLRWRQECMSLPIASTCFWHWWLFSCCLSRHFTSWGTLRWHAFSWSPTAFFSLCRSSFSLFGACCPRCSLFDVVRLPSIAWLLWDHARLSAWFSLSRPGVQCAHDLALEWTAMWFMPLAPLWQLMLFWNLSCPCLHGLMTLPCQCPALRPTPWMRPWRKSCWSCIRCSTALGCAWISARVRPKQLSTTEDPMLHNCDVPDFWNTSVTLRFQVKSLCALSRSMFTLVFPLRRTVTSRLTSPLRLARPLLPIDPFIAHYLATSVFPLRFDWSFWNPLCSPFCFTELGDGHFFQCNSVRAFLRWLHAGNDRSLATVIGLRVLYLTKLSVRGGKSLNLLFGLLSIDCYSFFSYGIMAPRFCGNVWRLKMVVPHAHGWLQYGKPSDGFSPCRMLKVCLISHVKALSAGRLRLLPLCPSPSDVLFTGTWCKSSRLIKLYKLIVISNLCAWVMVLFLRMSLSPRHRHWFPLTVQSAASPFPQCKVWMLTGGSSTRPFPLRDNLFSLALVFAVIVASGPLSDSSNIFDTADVLRMDALNGSRCTLSFSRVNFVCHGRMHVDLCLRPHVPYGLFSTTRPGLNGRRTGRRLDFLKTSPLRSVNQYIAAMNNAIQIWIADGAQADALAFRWSILIDSFDEPHDSLRGMHAIWAFGLWGRTCMYDEISKIEDPDIQMSVEQQYLYMLDDLPVSALLDRLEKLHRATPFFAEKDFSLPTSSPQQKQAGTKEPFQAIYRTIDTALQPFIGGRSHWMATAARNPCLSSRWW